MREEALHTSVGWLGPSILRRASGCIYVKHTDREGDASGRSSFFESLIVALEHGTCGGGPWYVPTLQLQLVSMQICKAVRSAISVHLWVRDRTPDDVWTALLDSEHAPYGPVPALRVRSVNWNHSCSPVDFTAWQVSFQLLVIDINRPIDEVVWPASLEQLEFGDTFNQPIGDVTWPPLLRRLKFRNRLDKAVELTSWPPLLEQLTFGHNFNRDIEDLTWPLSVQRLTFGKCFNRPVENVVWPASLQQLTFGDAFNRQIRNVAWPASLKQLTFGHRFNLPLEGVRWPSSLQQ